MHTLKAIAQRSAAFGAVFALVASTVVPSAVVLADELNPLTERSLLLSSSAPGYMNTDGSGNSVGSPNAVGENYAPAGSGPNGSKTGETFTFRVSTDSVAESRPIEKITLQYCQEAAGNCRAPGNNAPGQANQGAGNGWENETSDLEVVFDSPVAGTDFEVAQENTGDVSTGWSVAATNVEDSGHSEPLTGKDNFITLTHGEGGISPVFDEQLQVKFNASETNYITNPGEGSFFVKINTYDASDNIIDGGVTVANVMTDSIHITTKVLETMAFSVGTNNRDTVVVQCDEGETNIPEGCENDGAVHGSCDAIQQINNNRLDLGNPDAEYSLETDTAWDVYSYWRLSSNSSGGATVYYSGDTLRNTVGDDIDPIGATKATSTTGTEQFGLGFVDAGDDTFDPAFETGVNADPDDNRKMPGLYTLGMDTQYNGAEGVITGDEETPADAQFAFQAESNETPVAIATDDDDVISCATAKMRYVANIGADTPAGVYTTKVNYLAAPQY